MKTLKINFFFLIVFNTLLFTNFSLSQWYVQSIPTTNDLYSMQFINSDTAFAVGYNGTIIKTTNAGVNWFSQTSNTSSQLNCVKFIDVNTGFAVGGSVTGLGGIILKTTNGGVNWVSKSFDTLNFRTVFFVNSNTGYAGGWFGMNFISYYKTTNCGVNWIPMIINNINEITDFSFIDENNGWSLGFTYSNGLSSILRTTNGGVNWSVLNTIDANILMSINFININTGWVIGQSHTPWYGLIWKTTNSGVNWFSQNHPIINELYRSYFINENTGWVVGDVGAILKTTNSGLYWSRQSAPYTTWYWAVQFINENTGWIVGGNGRILKTTNSGGLFSISGTVKYADNNQPVTNGGYVKALKLDKTTGQILTFDSTGILTNGTYILSSVPMDSVDIGVYPNSSVTPDFVIGFYPATINPQQATVLYPTTNLTNIDVSVYRLNLSSTGNSVNGKVYKAFNGDLKDAYIYAKSGNNFVGITSSDNTGRYHLSSLPSGSLKIIVHRLGFSSDSTNVNLTNTLDSINFHLTQLYVGIKNISSIIPEKYNLFQNYPNPFNPVTKIKFEISTNPTGNTFLSVTLKIYDILGKEITTLVNEQLKPGVYEVEFNGSNFASGVYFYRLVAGDYIGVKKMFLIK